MYRFLNRKWIGYALWMLLAFSFHPYVLVLLVVPFIYGKKPWSISTWVIIIAMAVLGIGMESTAGFIARFNDVYDANSILDHTMNPVRFLVSLVPMGLSFLYRDTLFEDSKLSEDLFAHLSICRTMFYFWALYGNPIVFARVANYFDVSNAIFLAWIINKLCNEEETHRNGMVYKVGMFVCFFIFSYVANVLGFDFMRQTEHLSVRQFVMILGGWMRSILWEE